MTQSQPTLESELLNALECLLNNLDHTTLKLEEPIRKAQQAIAKAKGKI